MRVDALHLQGWRNYGTQALTFDPSCNVIYGENAQGKTNLLEAIVYLSCGKSPRAHGDKELIGFDMQEAALLGDIFSRQREFVTDIRLFRGKRRKMTVNGVPAKNSAALSDVLHTVFFAPEDLFLIRAGAAERRRFMDLSLCQLRPRYAEALSQYNRLYEHKTRILRDSEDKPELLDLLPEFNEGLCRSGAVLIGYRARFCAALAEYYAGAGKGSKRFVTITLGTGIGAGIIHNGKIFHGGNGMAGEVGHMSIEYNGKSCPCGRKGCWERYASASALKWLTQRVMEENPESILRQVVDENDGHVSGQSAFIAARRGDPVGQFVCDAYIDYLCAGIVNLVNIFQPDTLAIGGGVSNEQDEQLLFPVRRIVAQQSIPCEPERRTRIVKAELGSAAGIIGAALLGKKKRI